MLRIRTLAYIIYLLVFATGSNCLAFNSTHDRQLEYQQAANFTHLKWNNQLQSSIKLRLPPIKNYSGIPMENRDENAEYFYHGKLPTILDDIVADSLIASRYFSINHEEADYQLEFILDDYRLPFQYAPDDKWWEKLHAQTDRWLQTPASTYVKLSIKLSSGKKKIKSWMDSIEVRLSNCELNEFPQPATSHNNSNPIIKNYLSTTPGQSFLAATNFLIVAVIERIHQQAALAIVENRFDGEISLYSENGSFTVGDILEVYHNHPEKGKSTMSAGQVKVISANQNRALAYPLNMRADNIRENDWVTLPRPVNFSRPLSMFKPSKRCAEVITAEAN